MADHLSDHLESSNNILEDHLLAVYDSRNVIAVSQDALFISSSNSTYNS